LTLEAELPAPVLLRVAPNSKKVFARWTVRARCGHGPTDRFANLTPPTTVSAGGAFHRTERFSQRFTDALVRYRARSAGQFTSDGARGTLRVRARVYDRTGRHLQTRCDTRTRASHALLDT
jgi:hypothetical protein